MTYFEFPSPQEPHDAPPATLPAISALLFALAACDDGSSSRSSTTDNNRFGVDSILNGTWVGADSEQSPRDTVRITKDSLILKDSPLQSLHANKFDAEFYAHDGRMGTTNGQTVRDNVTFEYELVNDTLWMELQGTDRPDGTVDHESFLTEALIRLQ